MGGICSNLPHICPFCKHEIKNRAINCNHVCQHCVLDWFKTRHVCKTCKENIGHVYKKANQFMEILAMSTFIHVCIHRHHANIEHLLYKMTKMPHPIELEKEYNIEDILQIVLGLKYESTDFNALKLKYETVIDIIFIQNYKQSIPLISKITTSIIRNGLHPTIIAYTVCSKDYLNPNLYNSLHQFIMICERGKYNLHEFPISSDEDTYSLLSIFCKYNFNANINDNEFMQYIHVKFKIDTSIFNKEIV